MDPWLLLPLLLLLATGPGGALRDVRMLVVPPQVEAGQAATLLCEYDLEQQKLYSVKFYRGSHELYRYSATEVPARKVFPLPEGLPSVPIDLQRSNETQVYLGKVPLTLAGNVSCEVTTDETYVTSVVYTNLVVVVQPNGPPVLSTRKNSYDPEDTLDATCTSRPSHPAANLSFYLNEEPVGRASAEVWNSTENPGLYETSLDLRLQLSDQHFHQDVLRLKCRAFVPGFVDTNELIKIPRRSRQPVPARVTSPNSSWSLSSPRSSQPVLVVVLLLAARALR